MIGDTVIYPVQSGRIGVTRFHYNLDMTDDPDARCISNLFAENAGTRILEPTSRFLSPNF